jgi:TM2 domain-containing membrane protein YozV
MYRIIGGDGRPYGPVTMDQIRQWVAEGRATPQTLAQFNEGEWKPLAAFTEFITAPVIAPPAAPPPVFIPVNNKSRLAAGLLGIFVGGFGVHRFYLGYTGIGIAQIVVTFCTCGFGHFWGFIEGILIVAGVAITTDADGRPLRD